MSAVRRSSNRLAKLTAKASPYNASVTLYEAEFITEASPTKPRPIVKKRSESTSAAAFGDEPADIEDVKPVRAEPGPSNPVKRTVKTKTKVTTTTKSPKKPKVIKQSLETPHPAPPRWKETYDTIKEMRANIIAPVDTMGCEQAQLTEQDPRNQRFSTLVSLMLSSQTKDEVTDAAVRKLREAVGGTLSMEAIIAVDEGVVAKAIEKVGFWRRKTQYIKQTAQRLKDDFDSEVPKTVDELCSLPGVGPKMAFLALQVAWKLNVGIGVDVHVHRITNRLGWHKPPTREPEQTRLNLQSWLPIELHPDINLMLVGFGQTVCLPVKPRCEMCKLSTMDLCPSAKLPKSSPSKPRRVTSEELEQLSDLD
ncbi:DNA glycosylase [Coniophora puteana RWD-64-598 SS2]|uniref:Endonuclease III homolog n=1 Tax=Coniophora puteana (strain RWD-64-598) TaxID=741705 RepID=A0A5M3N2N9_CONPW|nr:DNA glycosylase [Coniophora puteana RWD-64-598 SS2]EIW85638.1 DNA glycosylase [Coniophora puteana RWD-64-598 SS2]